MIKTILIDDEQPAILELAYMLSKFDDFHIEGTFNKPQQALQYILFHPIDVVFLDISMPEMNGFLVAEAISKLKNPPMIVFVTAYDEYAIKAFEISAVDYLLKPLTEDRLEKAINRLRQGTYMKTSKASLEVMLNHHHSESKTARLPLWRDGKIFLVRQEDINCIEARKGECLLHTTSGIFSSTDSLQHFEDILNEEFFFRCHRSFIIRIESIMEVVPWYNNTYAVKIKDLESIQVPISRRNIKAFKEILKL